MTIIRIIDQPVLPAPPFVNYVQELHRQPMRTYREILGADYQPWGVGTPHVAIPYRFAVASAHAVTVAIPHGLNKDAAGNPVDTHKCIPDVVMPVRVHNLSGAGDIAAGTFIALAYNTMVVGAPWVNGFYADEDNVYLTLVNESQNLAEIQFFVYVEYTHSIIGDEFYTATQGTATVYAEDLVP